MREKMYILLFCFLGILNLVAFFVYKSHLQRQMAIQYDSLYKELNSKLAEGNERLKFVLSSISNDCRNVVEDFKSNIHDLPGSSFVSSAADKSGVSSSRKEIDYYWFIDCGVPKITIGREHYSLGDILPTGEKIIRITDYCLTTDDGIIFNSSSSFNRFKESEVKL